MCFCAHFVAVCFRCYTFNVHAKLSENIRERILGFLFFSLVLLCAVYCVFVVANRKFCRAVHFFFLFSLFLVFFSASVFFQNFLLLPNYQTMRLSTFCVAAVVATVCCDGRRLEHRQFEMNWQKTNEMKREEQEEQEQKWYVRMWFGQLDSQQ